MGNPEARESGFGYEELQGVFPHEPSKYKGGFAKDPVRLKEFVRKNMFLGTDVFNYDQISYKFLKSKG